ncbi:carboxymuconolactone decarboxylase family protein [Neolewinella aurantiaca]|uniref:Carboxymuconolactone decarboxylase family protein n=1 Tax=Neolewinella aurantiaca TaxID=2602767 RepID=A0A5C7FYR6_9BACT|nr:carboxymuconolactone decarboxylase family protein [Neolewinella aurantiaca]TXF90819.1 carboxymuconolactone decarboxylase family protein [Neolewinella aurantiaca]
MSTFNIPTRTEVSAGNQTIFDQLEKGLGFVPNLYATFAHSENALGNFLGFANGKTSLSAKEKEVIDLAVSEVNSCNYCLAAHTAIAKGAGFTEEQTLELREGYASFDSKLDALATFASETAAQRGKPSSESIEALLAAGYTRENIVDAVLAIGTITVTNYLHGITKVAVDFPAAPELAVA